MVSSVDVTRFRPNKSCSLCYDLKRQEVRCVQIFELGLDRRSHRALTCMVRSFGSLYFALPLFLFLYRFLFYRQLLLP